MSYIKPNHAGVISARDVLAEIRENTILVTIMAINNETGADNRKELISIGQGLALHNKKNKLRILFHSDCV